MTAALDPLRDQGRALAGGARRRGRSTRLSGGARQYPRLCDDAAAGALGAPRHRADVRRAGAADRLSGRAAGAGPAGFQCWIISPRLRRAGRPRAAASRRGGSRSAATTRGDRRPTAGTACGGCRPRFRRAGSDGRNRRGHGNRRCRSPTSVLAGTAKRVGCGRPSPASSSVSTRSEPRCDRRSATSISIDLVALPRRALGGQAVRSGDIGQRAAVVGDVGQEQPRLHRRVEGVGMEVDLRVGQAGVDPADDRLDIIKRRGAGRADIVHDPRSSARSSSKASSAGKRRSTSGPTATRRVMVSPC